MLNVLLGGMRGGTPMGDGPLRGREKSAFKLVDRALQIADGIAVTRLGDDAGLLPAERYLIANGAAEYLQEGQAVKLLKYSGPAMLLAGLSLWGYRCYECAAENKRRRGEVPTNPAQGKMLSLRGRAPGRAAPAPAQVANPVSGPPPNPAQVYQAPDAAPPTVPSSGNDAQDFWTLTDNN